MKTLNLFLCTVSVSVSFAFSQTAHKNDNDALQRTVLLADIKTLSLETPKLDGSLARALAKAEIADAAWTLDQTWASTLLKEAYQLTYLSEEELSCPASPPSAAVMYPDVSLV